MKKIFAAFLLFTVSMSSFGQKGWFSLYTDSTELITDANLILKRCINDLKTIKPDMEFDTKAIINTDPRLIFTYNRTVNLPFFEQLDQESISFFYNTAGNEEKGKQVFGSFFNGFFLPHELGHEFQDYIEGSIDGNYESEYFANQFAILWWRKNGNSKELEKCYEYAKLMLSNLPNPVPDGIDVIQYLEENLNKIQDSYGYGFFQFTQFVTIYEDKNLSDFDTFIKEYIGQKK